MNRTSESFALVVAGAAACVLLDIPGSREADPPPAPPRASESLDPLPSPIAESATPERANDPPPELASPWLTDREDAKAFAAAQGRLIVALASPDWLECPACDRLADAMADYLRSSRDVVGYRGSVDADTAARARVAAYPSVWVYDPSDPVEGEQGPECRLLWRKPGLTPDTRKPPTAAELIQELQSILESRRAQSTDL